MSKTAKSALQTKTTPNVLAFKNHIYTMGAAFAGVIFGVLGSMGFVGSYLNSQFAAQTAALDKRLVAVAPAAVTSADSCVGSSSASAVPGHASAKAGPVESHADAGGRGGDMPTPGGGGGSTTPFVNQLISGSISNTGPNSTAAINATNNFNYTQTNNNTVGVSNSNTQSSSSGSATNSSNTNGGSSTTGNSDNSSSTSTVIGIDN